MRKAIDWKSMIGKRYGRLIVLDRWAHDGYDKYHLKCVCDCGRVRRVRTSFVFSGHTRSCGCLTRESTIKRSTKHGHALAEKQSGTFTSWCQMKARCLNPKHKNYNDYGARGIDIDPRWIKSFEAFLSDLGERPEGDMTLERIDNEKGYWFWNCKWANRSEQAFNRRNSLKNRKSA